MFGFAHEAKTNECSSLFTVYVYINVRDRFVPMLSSSLAGLTFLVGWERHIASSAFVIAYAIMHIFYNIAYIPNPLIVCIIKLRPRMRKDYDQSKGRQQEGKSRHFY